MGVSTVARLLKQTATRHSSYGGGSAAALSCALAAALVEKLAGRTTAAPTARRLRARCTRLIDADAEAFARVIRASAREDQAAVRRALKTATDIPCQVGECAQQVLAVARRIKARVSLRYRVDLRCADALARAAKQSACALVDANRAWTKQGIAPRKP